VCTFPTQTNCVKAERRRRLLLSGAQGEAQEEKKEGKKDKEDKLRRAVREAAYDRKADKADREADREAYLASLVVTGEGGTTPRSMRRRLLKGSYVCRTYLYGLLYFPFSPYRWFVVPSRMNLCLLMSSHVFSFLFRYGSRSGSYSSYGSYSSGGGFYSRGVYSYSGRYNVRSHNYYTGASLLYASSNRYYYSSRMRMSYYNYYYNDNDEFYR
jgi:hypothetical protein